MNRLFRFVTQKCNLPSPAVFLLLLFVQTAMAAQPDAPPPDAQFLKKGRVWIKTENGIQRIWYENKKLKAQGTLKNGKPDGEWIHYFPTGAVKGSGSYQNGKKNGFWRLNDSRGNKHAEGNFKNDVREGIWTFYYPDGKIERQGNYRGGMQHGKWVAYYKNGEKFFEGNYSNGFADGPWSYYFQNGKLYQSGNYLNDMKVGAWTICITPKTACQKEIFVHSGVPSRSGLPSVEERPAPPRRKKSSPASILDSLEKGGVPDKVPDAIDQKWE